MYSRQQSSQVRKNFWTSFGQYMAPLPGADGLPLNWLNYKTGVKHLYFRMDAGKERSSIAIEMRHPDTGDREQVFGKLERLKTIFHEIAGPGWKWEKSCIDEDGRLVSRVVADLHSVNVINVSDWPTIISFLKPRLVALDKFWHIAKDHF